VLIMRATTIHGTSDVRLTDVPDPRIVAPTDAIVQVVASCICGSDLWAYRGVAKREPGQRIGHEFVGVVAEIGSDVTVIRKGDFVIAPFVWADGTCPYCAEGLFTSCPDGGFWGEPGSDGGQGEAVRVPYADATLVPVPGGAPDPSMIPALLALSDVMATGHHAALAAGARPGATVAVVGDGAVGLCGVLAAARLGAGRIIALGRNLDRTAIAARFGATDIVAARGDEAVAAVAELTSGLGAHAVLECVGTQQSLSTALAITRDGGRVGFVGVPHEVAHVDIKAMFNRNVGLGGGVAPARHYADALLRDVLAGTLDPSPVFDVTMPLADVAAGYAAMDDRSALKVLLTP
jgi:threonine dehydrogenase-like Zn-dependent dehydrogenase